MIYVLGGGTVSHVRSHLALCAPAYGGTARRIADLVTEVSAGEEQWRLLLTRMASPHGTMETNEDVLRVVDSIVADPDSKIVFHSVAHVDYDGFVLDEGEVGVLDRESRTRSGKYAPRLHTSEGEKLLRLTPAAKIVRRYRRERKDLFVVAFKTTSGASPDEQYVAALRLLKQSSINLVLANDVVTRHNMIVAPEETRYCETFYRERVLRELVRMTMARSRNTFTRSTVVPGELASFEEDPRIPENIREVVRHCVSRGAYKPGPTGATAGHFAVRLDARRCLTSRRKTNYNAPGGLDLVPVAYEGLDRVTAHGAKPSVGGQSQRIVFDEHPDADCIVHFHCPIKPDGASVPRAEQAPYECGSHDCGRNTSRNLAEVTPGIKAVMLDNHGPNIVFGRDVPAQDVIRFIEENFDLDAKTGGLVSA